MGDWKAIKLVKRGLSHIADGTNCQDSVTVMEDDRVLTAALADGLGSLLHSELAAKAATQAVCAFFSKTQPEISGGMDPVLGDQILACVRDAIRSVADENGVSTQEMDCTLVFVFVDKINSHALIGVLGDSAVCVMGVDSCFVINGGATAADGTNAVLDKDAREQFLFNSLDLDKLGILGFFLTSDGLEKELYIKGSERVNSVAASYFNTLLHPEEAEAVVADRIERITSTKNTIHSDDISLIILSRADKRVELPPDPTWLCTCGERNPLQNSYCAACHNDFVLLYGNIRFRDYGGKAAFFERINAAPDEERKLVGLPVTPSDDHAAEEVNAANNAASPVTGSVPPESPPTMAGVNVTNTEQSAQPLRPGDAADDVSESWFDQRAKPAFSTPEPIYAMADPPKRNTVIIPLIIAVIVIALSMTVLRFVYKAGIKKGEYLGSSSLEGEIEQLHMENTSLRQELERAQEMNEETLKREYEQGFEDGKHFIFSESIVVPTESDTKQDQKITPEQFTIEKGQTGEIIGFIQNRLNEKGWSLTVDGIFGSLTETAVREFQAANQLSATGKVDILTYWMLMNEQSAGIEVPKESGGVPEPVKPGASDNSD